MLTLLVLRHHFSTYGAIAIYVLTAAFMLVATGLFGAPWMTPLWGVGCLILFGVALIAALWWIYDYRSRRKGQIATWYRMPRWLEYEVGEGQRVRHLMCLKGTQEAIIEDNTLNLYGAEIISASAVFSTDGVIYAVMMPGRHSDCNWAIWADGKVHDPRREGFLTSRGRYVDRKEALVIATLNGQVRTKHGSPDELYSEDMW